MILEVGFRIQGRVTGLPQSHIFSLSPCSRKHREQADSADLFNMTQDLDLLVSRA